MARRPLIAFLVPQTKESFADSINAFLSGMKELGYVDGQNLTIEYRYADAILDRQASLAAKLVKLGPDVILTASAASVRTSEATSTIPIVVGNFTPGTPGVTQLVGPNLVRPLVANVTGIVNSDVGPRQQFELVKEMFPGTTQVGYMLGTDSTDVGASLRARADAGAAAAAAAAGIKLVYAEASSADRVEPAFRSLVSQRVPVVVFSASALFAVTTDKYVPVALAERMPTVGTVRTTVAAGGLMSLGGDAPAGFKRAATYVDRILKGAKTADLPVEQLEVQILTVNLNTARSLGLTIPPAVLARATEKIRLGLGAEPRPRKARVGCRGRPRRRDGPESRQKWLRRCHFNGNVLP